MPSIVDICNLALDKIGAEGSLTSLTDPTKEGRLCNKHYDGSRRSVLTQHPWKFAAGRVVLSPLVTPPAFDYNYQYDLPPDCLQVRIVNDDESEWRVEGRRILCQYSVINLRYTLDVADSSLFHAQFCDVVAYHLASKICYALTQSNEREQFLASEFMRVTKLARHSDAVQNSPPALQANYFDEVRIGPNRGFVRDPQT